MWIKPTKEQKNQNSNPLLLSKEHMELTNLQLRYILQGK